MKRRFWFIVVCMTIFVTCSVAAEEKQSEDRVIIEVGKDLSAVCSVGDAAIKVVTVAGGSGSSIMTTLAAPAGVVAGTVVTGGFAGSGASRLLNEHVFNGDSEADKAARTGTKIGAAVGTAGAVATIVTVGAGPTGLATVGAAVGGGMAAGAITLVAAPAAAAVAVGALFYWLAGG